MARKFAQRNTRKITRSGNSLSVSLPVKFVAKLGWKEKQKVKLSRVHGGILIKDWKK